MWEYILFRFYIYVINQSSPGLAMMAGKIWLWRHLGAPPADSHPLQTFSGHLPRKLIRRNRVKPQGMGEFPRALGLCGVLSK